MHISIQISMHTPIHPFHSQASQLRARSDVAHRASLVEKRSVNAFKEALPRMAAASSALASSGFSL